MSQECRARVTWWGFANGIGAGVICLLLGSEMPGWQGVVIRSVGIASLGMQAIWFFVHAKEMFRG
jgi:hypothetical protein